MLSRTTSQLASPSGPAPPTPPSGCGGGRVLVSSRRADRNRGRSRSLDVRGASAWRASSESTLPTDDFRLAASKRRASRTSSSMSSVVRTHQTSRITHPASNGRRPAGRWRQAGRCSAESATAAEQVGAGLRSGTRQPRLARPDRRQERGAVGGERPPRQGASHERASLRDCAGRAPRGVGRPCCAAAMNARATRDELSESHSERSCCRRPLMERAGTGAELRRAHGGSAVTALLGSRQRGKTTLAWSFSGETARLNPGPGVRLSTLHRVVTDWNA